jgi:glycine cleavage system H protein
MKFTQSHEWIDLKGSTGTVGVSHYAQKELGEIVNIQLPKIGQTVKAGGEIAVLESTKAAADVYSPVSGKITALNESLLSDPGLVNRSPESSGWLFRIELSHPNEVNKLLSREQYHALTSG